MLKLQWIIHNKVNSFNGYYVLHHHFWCDAIAKITETYGDIYDQLLFILPKQELMIKSYLAYRPELKKNGKAGGLKDSDA